MSGGETNAERQDNELELLQAVYTGDVVDLRTKSAWKVWRPLELQITLKPQESVHSGIAYVMLDLVVRLTDQYPETLPNLTFINVKGLSNQQLDTLKTELMDLAKSQLGEVMILELCQHVQQFLHTNNKPPAKSFYEEMMGNQKKQEEKLAMEQKKKMELEKEREAKQLHEIEAEIQKRKLEARKRREEAKQMERLSLSEPSTPIQSDVHGPSFTPIPRDTEQKRNRAASSPDAARSPGTRQDRGLNYVEIERKKERRSLELDEVGLRRTSTPMSSQDEDNCIAEEAECCSDHSGTKVIVFNTKGERTVQRGKCLGHSIRSWSTVYAAMDMSTGELLAVSEFTLRWRHTCRKLDLDEKRSETKTATRYLQQVASVESELLSLLRLRHKNLCHYHAIKYTQDVGSVTIYLLMDYAGGGSLSTNLKRKQPTQMELVRNYTSQLLEALVYLHDKAVTHKDLRASSVLLDTSGAVRLAHYSLKKRLSDMVSNLEAQLPGVKFEQMTTAPPAIGRGGKKADIYRLGVLLLSLAQGYEETNMMPEVPTNLPQDFQDFLTKCLIKDERHRWTANQLLEHSFISTPLYATFHTAHKKPEITQGEKQKDKREEEEDDDNDGDGAIPFIPSADSGSRLKNEFEIMKYLGKGAFGDVIKVRNKLDARLYAIKRIPLDPRSKQLTKKITREVKLLSRLNHENVVRYYNSWIETSEEPVVSDTSSTNTTTNTSTASPMGLRKHKTTATPLVARKNNTLGFFDDFEKMAPPMVDGSVEWSVSCDITGNRADDSGDSSSDDEDSDFFGTSFLPHSDSEEDDVIFDHQSGYNKWSDETEVTSESKVTSSSSTEIIPRLQFLYIQMEFCEKSTLRNCIDAGLYQDMDRMWRLFREIIEGLLHIHEQGMIHRDLKPVNMFLDSNDHIKIGDFGLATTDIVQAHTAALAELSQNPSVLSEIKSEMSKSESLGDGGLTGKVGTALYVSPEMEKTHAKAHYNQKVDIYSLGIILFEMCYRPLDLGMERVQILGNLRKETIDFPDDFNQLEMENQSLIIKWLLTHNPAKRPTAQELLQSDYLPPPQMEEAELNEVLRSTIANPEGKSYKHMINAIYSQPILPTMDFAYDSELYKNTFSERIAVTQRYVTASVVKIFEKHGALKVNIPHLMPRNKVYDNSENFTCFMDKSGGIVALPYDLWIPFARYVARNSITNIKRYSIDKVFRENRWLGSHPRELMACSFDIISSHTHSFIYDAETIHVVSDIINEFPLLQEKNYYLRMNHMALLRAVLLHCEVPEELFEEVCAILGDTKTEKQQKLQLQTRLCSLSLSEQTVAKLYHYVSKEDSYGQVASMLRCITKSKGQASSLAKKGLHEMEAIIGHAENLGCKFQPRLALGMVHNIPRLSSVVYQIVASVRRKKKVVLEVLAAGSRYDKLIESFQPPGKSYKDQLGVGVSIAFDRVVSAALEDQSLEIPGLCEVLVCSLGHKSYLKEKLQVSRELWSAGLMADIYPDPTQSLETIQDYCKSRKICHLVILKDLDVERGYIKVGSFEKEKMSERRMSIGEVAEYILQQKKTTSEADSSNISSQKQSQSFSEKVDTKSETSGSTGSNMAAFNITYYNQEEDKKGTNTYSKKYKRQYDNQIYSALQSISGRLSHKMKVEVFGLDINMEVIKSIVAYLDLNEDQTLYQKSIGAIIERHPRYRKFLSKVFDHISDLRSNKK